MVPGGRQSTAPSTQLPCLNQSLSKRKDSDDLHHTPFLELATWGPNPCDKKLQLSEMLTLGTRLVLDFDLETPLRDATTSPSHSTASERCFDGKALHGCMGEEI